MKYIVGKQISAVVVAANDRDPRTQLFLVFSDGTYFEIWGNTFTGAGALDRGGTPEVLQYVTTCGGRVTATYPEPGLTQH
ncbi:hypothetical protein [Lysobacter fragariae]